MWILEITKQRLTSLPIKRTPEAHAVGENMCCIHINKKLYRAFRRQANGFTLNIPVLQGLLIGTLPKICKVEKWKMK